MDEPTSHFVSAASLRRRLVWFDKLRWFAAAGAVTATLVARSILPDSLPFGELMAVAGLLVVFNVSYLVRNRRLQPTSLPRELMHVKLQMAADLILLTALLHLSGGIENPLFFLYMIHVVIASLLFKGRDIFFIAWLAIVLFTADVAAENLHLVAHHHLLSASSMTHEPPFILLTLGSFWLVLLSVAYIGATIMQHNRSIKNELVQRQHELVAADRAKLDFFRFVTHEIKSPVATALSAVDASLQVGGDRLPPKTRDILGRARVRLEHAIRMIVDLADFTRGGDMKPEAATLVDLNGLIMHIVDSLGDEARARGITVDVRLPDPGPCFRGYAGMLDRIIRNLVSNAVRYSEDGGRVDVRLDQRPGDLSVRVADEGIGIAPEEHAHIFEEFYRSEAARRKTTLGTGLGLPIVKRYTEQLGGAVTLVSEPGQGSEFTITLPVPSDRDLED